MPTVRLKPLAERGTFQILVADAVVGECGWRGPPDADGEVEISYEITAAQRGRGFGTAAAEALLDWLREQPGVRRVRAEALIGNEPSQRLLLQLGFLPATDGHPPYVAYLRQLN